ncbi:MULTISPECIES: hypothetical protein [Mesorhizobium]|uniref:hypothetical protein n=1 Tax=Mesorhizobium TaxID=68287 RepID=UPI0003CE4E24|nr:MULTISPECIES: hypothetical protein [Mesorhizobium]ESY66294.1 hypothetical protein X742_19350 [Mesorhizobium sp. LNHC232B00]WJI42176.1 hypothetical protein NL534_33165 [Mesorhizobium opportunistum]
MARTGYSLASNLTVRSRVAWPSAHRLVEELVGDVEMHVAEKLLPALRAAIGGHLGEPTKGEWSLKIDAGDLQTINFHYPTALAAEEYEGMAYIHSAA